jgi:hypothetical protein
VISSQFQVKFTFCWWLTGFGEAKPGKCSLKQLLSWCWENWIVGPIGKPGRGLSGIKWTKQHRKHTLLWLVTVKSSGSQGIPIFLCDTYLMLPEIATGELGILWFQLGKCYLINSPNSIKFLDMQHSHMLCKYDILAIILRHHLRHHQQHTSESRPSNSTAWGLGNSPKDLPFLVLNEECVLWWTKLGTKWKDSKEQAKEIWKVIKKRNHLIGHCHY